MEQFDEQNKVVTDLADTFSEMVNSIVSEHSEGLDQLMSDLNYQLTREEPISTNAVERYYAELTSSVYFLASSLEKLNVFSDMSKANAKDVYNKAYLEACSEKDEKGKAVRTVAENTSIAETKAQYSATVNTVYDHAYKTLRMKVDMAMEMISTLKNILKKRVQEDYLNSQVSSMKTNFDNE